MTNRPIEPIDVLMVADQPLWPLDQGYRVHGYHMLTALRRIGVRATFSSMDPIPADAPRELWDYSVDWPGANRSHQAQLRRGWSGLGSYGRHRLAGFEGLEVAALAGVNALVDRYRPAVVIGVGLRSPLMLRALAGRRQVKRIWYAADELMRFHLTCLRRQRLDQWPARLMKLAQHAALETLFVRGLDGAIGVSPTDTRLLRCVAGVRDAVTIRNGVDLGYFSPVNGPMRPRSAVFWGRLDFEPNEDGVCWFADKVWPGLKQQYRDAAWQIIGKGDSPPVQLRGAIEDIDVVGPVDDIRPYADAASAVILPIRCGGGIKNKLLEAAAMGKPIVASPRAVDGLDYDQDRPPFLVCRSVPDWQEAIGRVWSDGDFASKLARRARRWVASRHTWKGAAEKLARWVEVDDRSTQDGKLQVQGAALTRAAA